jgi:hypothetical protein
MDRRTFLRYAAIGGCGVLLHDAVNGDIPCANGAERLDLVIAHGQGKSPSVITKAAIDAFGGIKKFVSRGDVVIVKPNMGWDRLPEQAANTNPEVVSTIVKLCFEAGAKKVKVFDRTAMTEKVL